MPTPNSRDVLRFRDFELDLAAYELRRHGRPVKLGRQPMDLLILLVERRGHLVSRSDIVERLWGKDVFVDVETGVNTAVSKVRQALRDSAGAPALLETVAGKGYRFIATVEVVSAGPPRPPWPPPHLPMAALRWLTQCPIATALGDSAAYLDWRAACADDRRHRLVFRDLGHRQNQGRDDRGAALQKPGKRL